MIRLSKYVFYFFTEIFIVIYSLGNFLLDELKKTEETFLSSASMKVSYL
jgi:hypothetical protein